MREIVIPFRIEDLVLKPEMAGRIKLSDDMQQTLASLVGYDNIARRLLRCTMGGVLHTTTSRIADILHVAVVGDEHYPVGPDVKTTEVMLMGHPSNTGLVWVTSDETASVDNGWPLAAKEVVGFTVDNLNNIHAYIVEDADKLIALYTR